MEFSLKNIKVFIQMLSMTLGKFAEISLSDREKYLYVEHSMFANIKKGLPLGDDEKYILDNENLSKLPFVVNYKSLGPNMMKLRSSTYLFRDSESGVIKYLMTITVNVDQLVSVRDLMDTFINGASIEKPKQTKKVNNIPKLNLSYTAIIEEVIVEGETRYGTTTDRMTMKEKQSLIREMFHRGVFLIKGTVGEVSLKMGNSEATIYRYLKELEKNEYN